MKRKIQKSI